MGADVSIAIKPTVPLDSIKADMGQIEQVLMNLVVNARDAMPKGGEISIETRNVKLEGDFEHRHEAVRPAKYVLLSVSDSGCGMNAGTRSRIFEPFFTTKEPWRGAGLGLFTVYEIVKQSGGYISVESEIAKGSTFKLYFPSVAAAQRT